MLRYSWSAAFLLLLASCDAQLRAPATSETGAEVFACTRCHGTGSDPAPPRSVLGETSPTSLAVGAHQVHLRDGALHRAFPCTECHVVPTDLAHIDGAARVRFGPIASAGGVSPAWARATATCTTYCHGATLTGGTLQTPVWTAGASQAACGSCHGAPPPPPHTASRDCGSCHIGYGPDFVNLALHVDGHVQVDGSGSCGSCHAIPPPPPHTTSTQCGSCHPGYTSTSVVPGTHGNGVVDVAMTCTSCHGDAARTSGPKEAPPFDTAGRSATSARGVGAHQAHLVGGSIATATACAECHTVPTSTSHSNGVVEIVFGAKSRLDGATPSWNSTALTCATYCHGATLAGGSAKTPLWTRVDGTQKTCTSCHGAPPPAPHSTSTACGSCHGAGYSATTVNAATHVDGHVDLGGISCTSCHGDASRTSGPKEAPPVATNGATATSARGVGAHQAHLVTGALASATACGECHNVPTSTAHSNGVVEVVLGARSSAGGATPSWNTTALTCATYCHGATLAGGTAKTPLWTRVDGTQKTCTSCHGAPPPAPHAQRTDCGSCHGGYTASTANVSVHIDGKLDVSAQTCTTCHGDAARTNGPKEAPPVATDGATATTARGVGAHQAHLTNGSLRAAIACSECHVVPTSSTHASGVAEVAFGPLARTGGAGPAWSTGSLTCSGTYCHGATLAGGSAKTPLWTKVDGTQKTCSSCHGAPPPAPHSTSTACGSCHTGYTATTVNLTTHLNGTVDVVAMSCTTCHGDAARTSGPKEAPPVDTAGRSATTARGVGAHQAHLVGGAISNATACNECHTVPTSTSHSNGVVEIVFGAKSRLGGVTPSWSTSALTCTTYCHGANLTGGTAKTPLWTKVDGTQKTCSSCHGAPPLTGEHDRSNHRSAGCGACHSGYTNSSANTALHLDGIRNVGGSGTSITSWNATTRQCTMTCHSSETW